MGKKNSPTKRINLQLSFCMMKSKIYGQFPIFNFGCLLRKGKEYDKRGHHLGHLCLVSIWNYDIKDFCSKIEKYLNQNDCDKILEEFNVVVLEKEWINPTGRIYKVNRDMHEALEKTAIELFQCKTIFGRTEYNSNLIPDPFASGYKKQNDNCYVQFSDGELGFKYKNELYLLSVPAEKKSFFNIYISQYFSIDLSSKSIAKKLKIIGYGIKNTRINSEFDLRLKTLKQYLPETVDFSDFLLFLRKNRNEVKIVPYYKKLLSCNMTEYENVFSFVVHNTIDMFFNPELLSLSISKPEKEILPISESNNSHLKKRLTYLDYRETNGIYYSLSNEDEALSDDLDDTFNIMHLKKFAYVPSDVLDKYFSLLSVNIQPNNNRIQFKYYKDKWNEIILPIKIEQYTATIDTSLSGIVRILCNIVCLVADKINISERHSTVSHNNTNNYYIKHEQRYKNPNATIELHRSRSKNSNANVLVINHQELNKGLAEKKMHYRIGHWHYYWYGAHNSAERHKELKWVEETIVNREAANIIIVL